MHDDLGRNGRRLILVSNDDGIGAPGIQALAAAVAPLGDVLVVAPATEQSAVGHAITVRDPIRLYPYPFEIPTGRLAAYSVAGTPADCVKLAINELLPRRPDLVVSGINQGPNTAVNVMYSGTVSAATEAAILGFDAAAFSLCAWTDGHFDTAARFAHQIAQEILQRGLPPGILLNVNIPSLPYDDVDGVQVTRQARSRWIESFDKRHDPFDRPYYWMAGQFVNLDDDDTTDLAAIEARRVSVTPLQFDLTAHPFLSELHTWSWDPSDAAAPDEASSRQVKD
ncbi:MAG: 5'/3'-nucleotidase SurE [Bacteroidota bacterium]